jgi:hypothetical protein
MNWNDYPNFSKEEFDCKHSGKNEMKPDFMDMLQDLRTKYSSKNLFQPSNTLIDGEQIPLDSFLGSLLLLGIQSHQRL